MNLPAFSTPRLLIRPFQIDDLQAIYRILDLELGGITAEDRPKSLDERSAWLEWTVASYTQLADLHQPPYGDRAVVLQHNNELVGACGFAPCLAPFEQLPGYDPGRQGLSPGRFTPEVGLYYAISPRHQRHGYASEAARALVDLGFRALKLKRILATTTDGNLASLAVMRKLGMRIARNPLPEPPWLQWVGVLENPENDL